MAANGHFSSSDKRNADDVDKALHGHTPDGKICDCKKGGRNVIVCIDGTSNEFGTKVRKIRVHCAQKMFNKFVMQNTNVIELYSRLKDIDNQKTYYNSGIGAYANPARGKLTNFRQTISAKWDMAFARFVRHSA